MIKHDNFVKIRSNTHKIAVFIRIIYYFIKIKECRISNNQNPILET